MTLHLPKLTAAYVHRAPATMASQGLFSLARGALPLVASLGALVATGQHSLAGQPAFLTSCTCSRCTDHCSQGWESSIQSFQDTCLVVTSGLCLPALFGKDLKTYQMRNGFPSAGEADLPVGTLSTDKIDVKHGLRVIKLTSRQSCCMAGQGAVVVAALQELTTGLVAGKGMHMAAGLVMSRVPSKAGHWHRHCARWTPCQPSRQRLCCSLATTNKA